MVVSLGAAMALASPSLARPRGGGGGGAVHAMGGGGGGAPHAMGHTMGPGGGSFGDHMSGNIGNRGAANFNRGARFNGAVAGRTGPAFAVNNRHRPGNWDGRRWHHRRYGSGFGVGLAFGAAPYYDDYYDPYGYDSYAYVPYESYAEVPAESDASVQYCIDHFKSYDVASQTYLGYDGRRHSCP